MFAIVITGSIALIAGIVALAGAGVGTVTAGVLRTRRENRELAGEAPRPKKGNLAALVGVAAALLFFLPRPRPK